MNRVYAGLLVVFMAMLSGCGGGGSTSSTVSGTASQGTPIAVGTVVNLVDANGNAATSKVQANGLYSVTVNGLTAPYVLNTGGYYSFASTAGTTNINPFTHLSMQIALGTSTISDTTVIPATFQTKFTSAVSVLMANIDGLYPPSVTQRDFLGGNITLDTGVDKVFGSLTTTTPDVSGNFAVSVNGLQILSVTMTGNGGATTTANTQNINTLNGTFFIKSTTGKQSVAAKTINLAVGDASCPNGGIQIQTGIDINGNGILDPSEVTNSQNVCNGATGAAGAIGANGKNGLNSLVRLTPEPSGSNCATGGERIDIGVDTNNNGTLDTSEVSSTSYTCNGATGPAGAAGAGVPWVSTIGSTQQAAPNTGYLANSTSQVAVTLPASPSAGDTVQVTGVGTGGWKVAQNAGQFIIGNNLPWSAMSGTSGTYANNILACSADGTKLVSVIPGGQIYISSDSGTTWTPRGTTQNWSSVASSADGSKLVAVVAGGQIYISSDSGTTWTPTATSQGWLSVASSADGSKLVAVVTGGQIYISSDSGTTWTPKGTTQLWHSVASSADGSKLVAVVNGGQIYISSDSGTTWTPSGTSQNWVSVASSADGSKLAAVVYGGQIYISSDSGTTWTPRGTTQNWYSIATSADGSKLVAVAFRYLMCVSTDSGLTWTTNSDPSDEWHNVISSSDGNKLFVSTNGGMLYKLIKETTIGTAGSINGGQYDAVELQYIGNNTFTILSNEGNLKIQ